MEIWICILAVLISAGSILWYRRKTKKTLDSIGDMLRDAIAGDFQERRYDESMLSSIELKMVKYLSSSEVSKQNLRAERNKIKELISDISHQTKTPIANILLFSELLNEQELPEQSRQYVTSLMKQGEKLNFLVGALVKMSRLENGIMELHPYKQAIAPLIENVAAQIKPLAMEKKLNIYIEKIDGEGCYDRKWTEEAIYNIVHNAVKYTSEGGTITIRERTYELFTSIQIEDTGLGISEEDTAKIFRRFYRASNVLEEEGVGIGLYLARQIVSSEGGYIKVSSKEGKGSIFMVYLPRE